jgi:hypothetical protein
MSCSIKRFSFLLLILALLNVTTLSKTTKTTTEVETPKGLNGNRYQRCYNIVNRLYLFLDIDGDGTLEDDEVKKSDLSALGLTDQDRAHLIEGCYFITEMTTEDIHVYFDRCARMNQYLAHFNLLDGQDIFERFMDPSSDNLMDQMLISKSDRVQLRRRLFKSILSADRENILTRNTRLTSKGGLVPTISNLKPTSLAIRLPVVEQASGYKVQYCEVDDGKSSDQPVIDVCGFAWSAVYPTAGVHVVRLYGLKPLRKYRIRVRAFFCDGASSAGKTVEVTAPSLKAYSSNDGDSSSSHSSSSIQHLPNPTIKRVSASRDTILLSWGGGCLVDANTMRAIKTNLSAEHVCLSEFDGNNNIMTSPFSTSPVTWEVKYDRDEGMGCKGSWKTAGCVEARRVDNMNDDPFSCFIQGMINI